MTNAEPNSNQERSGAVTPSDGSFGTRAVDWFWRRTKLAEIQRELPELQPRAALMAQRARATAELAFLALTPAEPLEMPVEGYAAESYRQAAYWALCALSGAADESVGTSYLDSAWSALDDATLSGAVTSAERVEVLRSSLQQGSFVYFAELSAAEQAAVCVEVRQLAESLIAKLNERNRVLERVYFQRAARVGLVVLLTLALLVGLFWLRKTRDDRNDLTVGKAWSTSSQYEQPGCTSPAQQCSESPNYFFCTSEDAQPWVEFDLGQPLRFSTVQVDNRTDCCTERAVPLVIEVSDNHKRWREVARRDAEFTTWRATFSSTQARYVRLRVTKRSFLHLLRVRILP